MSLSNKIRALLLLRNKKSTDFSNYLGLNKLTALNTKLSRESFKAQELIQLAEFTDTELCFIDKQTGDVVLKFQNEDIKKDTE